LSLEGGKSRGNGQTSIWRLARFGLHPESPIRIKPVGVMIVALELLLNLGMSYWFT